MGRKSSIPWSDIKKKYVQGVVKDGERVYPTQKELAENYQVDTATMSRKCSKEDWDSERQIFINKLSIKCQEKTIEQISDKGVDFDMECFKQAQRIQKKIELYLEKINEDTAIKPTDLAALVKALKDNQSYAKEALGESGKLDVTVNTNNIDEQLKEKPNAFDIMLLSCNEIKRKKIYIDEKIPDNITIGDLDSK